MTAEPERPILFIAHQVAQDMAHDIARPGELLPPPEEWWNAIPFAVSKAIAAVQAILVVSAMRDRGII